MGLGRDCPVELFGKGGNGGAGGAGARAGAEEDRVQAAGEGGRVRVEAAGEVGDCIGGQRRSVDLGGFEQQGQPYGERKRDAEGLYREEKNSKTPVDLEGRWSVPTRKERRTEAVRTRRFVPGFVVRGGGLSPAAAAVGEGGDE
jgi:hypothetical protein